MASNYTNSEQLTLILQKLQSKDSLLIRNGLSDFSKLISENDALINEYFNLSPNCVELFGDEMFKIIANNNNLSILWIKLIIIILEKGGKKTIEIIDNYLLSSSSKYKIILINLKSNNKQIDSQFILVQLINKISIISNEYLLKLINLLKLNEYHSWHSFWIQCKNYKENKLKTKLLNNCYHFGMIVISSNNSKIISIMSQNKPFWNLIKYIIEQHENNLIFKYVLRYFQSHKLTLNRNINNLEFLQFWLFVLFDFDDKYLLNKLLKIALNIKNVYHHLTIFLLKISLHSKYFQTVIDFFSKNDNFKFITNFIQKREWKFLNDEYYFDEISLLNDLYKILENNKYDFNKYCIPKQLNQSIINSKLMDSNIIISYSMIHLLYNLMSKHNFINLLPSNIIHSFVDIYFFQNKDNNIISMQKYQTLLTQIIIQYLKYAPSDNIDQLWNILNCAQNINCRNDIFIKFINELNNKCSLWNNENYINILYQIIYLLTRNNKNNQEIINFIINSVLPSNKRLLIKTEMSTFLNCITNNQDCITFTVLLLSYLKFENDIFDQIHCKYSQYSLFVLTLYLLKVSEIKNIGNLKWLNRFYQFNQEWFILNQQLSPKNNIKQIEQFFKTKLNLNNSKLSFLSKIKTKSNSNNLFILNRNFKEKYYLNNVYAIFIDICHGNYGGSYNEKKLNDFVNECCKYFENICVYLTETEIKHLNTILSVKLFEKNRQNGNALYFKILSSILKGIGMHHSSKSVLMRDIKQSLNIKELIKDKYCYNINIIQYLLYYLDKNIVLQNINNLIKNKKWNQVSIWLNYICNDKSIDIEYLLKCINNLNGINKKIVIKYLNNSYWSLCHKVFNYADCDKIVKCKIFDLLLTKIDINLIIDDDDNNDNICILLNILLFISYHGKLNNDYISMFIILLKQKSCYQNKLFFKFLNECLNNFDLSQQISLILIFIFKSFKQLESKQNNDICKMYFETIHLCFKQLLIKNDQSDGNNGNNKQIIDNLNGIFINNVNSNWKWFWKFMCDLCHIKTSTNCNIKQYIDNYCEKLQGKYMAMLKNKSIDNDTKVYILKIVNKFYIKLDKHLINNLFNDFDGLSNEFNVELINLIKWSKKNHRNDINLFNLMICKFSKYNQIQNNDLNNVENKIISWFNQFEPNILKKGPNYDHYHIDFIWISIQEILKKLNNKQQHRKLLITFIKKLISSALFNYILIGMNNDNLLIRKKCYGLFDIFYKLLYLIRNDCAIYYKWYYMIETLRLSIKTKYEMLDLEIIKFIIDSIHISANPFHFEYSIICESFYTKSIIKKQHLPLQHRMLLTHFIDIERHRKMTHIKKTNSKFIRNRLKSQLYNL